MLSICTWNYVLALQSYGAMQALPQQIMETLFQGQDIIIWLQNIGMFSRGSGDFVQEPRNLVPITLNNA